MLAELRVLQAFREPLVGSSSQILALGLSSRKNMCVNAKVSEEGSRESVDAGCRKRTASWVRERKQADEEVELCQFYEDLEDAGTAAVLPAGVYTLQDLRAFGRRRRWCPYYLARHTLGVANVIVYNYQYMLDPKVAGVVSKELEKECVVVFDEAHNIDNVCIEALSVQIRRQTLDGAHKNISSLNKLISRAKATDERRLRAEYERLVSGLTQSGALEAGAGGEEWLANPVIPADVLREAVPGNIRRAEHFLALLTRLVEVLRAKLSGASVSEESPSAFLATLAATAGIDAKTLRFCYERLSSLLKTLQVTDVEEFWGVSCLADFATLVGTYPKGFALIYEPCDERAPAVPDPVLQLCCLDASLAMRPVFAKYSSVFITSGTLSPLELYPKLLDFHPVSIRSMEMTLTRDCLCPLVVTRGADQLPLSTKFDMRTDPAVVRNYGRLIVDLASVVPDGMVCFFVSYTYMDNIVAAWNESGVLAELMSHKLVFIETTDVVETTLALDNYRRACNAGRGAVFLSVARGKVAEGIDFERHYGRAVIMMGVPYQYTLARPLRARLSYLREAFQIREADFLSFDAIRQAAQCMGRVIRSKADYGLMVLADKRYNSTDKRGKLPKWIISQLRDEHLNLSTDMALVAARKYMRSMAQPFERNGATLLDQNALNRLASAQPRMGL